MKRKFVGGGDGRCFEGILAKLVNSDLMGRDSWIAPQILFFLFLFQCSLGKVLKNYSDCWNLVSIAFVQINFIILIFFIAIEFYLHLFQCYNVEKCLWGTKFLIFQSKVSKWFTFRCLFNILKVYRFYIITWFK